MPQSYVSASSVMAIGVRTWSEISKPRRTAKWLQSAIGVHLRCSARRSSIHFDDAAGRGTHRASGPEEAQDHGGSHVPLHRCGQENPTTRRRRYLGGPLLL